MACSIPAFAAVRRIGMTTPGFFGRRECVERKADCAGRVSTSGRERSLCYAGRISLPANPARLHPCTRSVRGEIQRRNRRAHQVMSYIDLKFLGVVSYVRARRNFVSGRERTRWYAIGPS